MKILVCCLLAALTASIGCLDLHGVLSQQDGKKTPAVAATPPRPPVTEDQVTEANAANMVQALTEELNRAERSAPD